jgi:hypothetical protein
MGENLPDQPVEIKGDRLAREISNLKRREIQAPPLACLLDGFIREMGHDKALEIASLSIQGDATKVGKLMAGKYGGNGIQELLRVIREIWAEDNALEFTILESTDQKLSFNVTRCRYAELYDRLGVKVYGYCLSCNRDAPLIKGFNPRMNLIRSQTIMQGASICDFRIILEK